MKPNENKLPALIFVIGLPASGKTTLAKRLKEDFGIPVLEKDEYKETLFDTVGFQDYPEKRRLDEAANAVLLKSAGAMLDSGVDLIVVNNFRKEMEGMVRDFLKRHPCRPATLFLEGDADEFYRRYARRDKLKERHLAHALQDHYPLKEGENAEIPVPTREDYRRMFESLGMQNVDLGCPCLHVKAGENDPFDLPAIEKWVQNETGFAPKKG